MITSQSHQHAEHDEYDEFVQTINNRFNSLTGPIFETDAAGLYEAYLNGFPAGPERQYHTCSCCQQFIERFGGLATINDDGHVVSALWDYAEAPRHYQQAILEMERIVHRAKPIMPFLSQDLMYGTPVSEPSKKTGIAWHHFGVKPGPHRVYRQAGIETPFQTASLKREEFGSVRQALGEYTSAAVITALQILKSDSLPNSAAVMGQAQFLYDLHAARDSVAGQQRKDNLVFRAVAAAPSGFCHPRSSMIATLLDDIVAGKSFDQAKAAWTKKMHPLQYQRPQAAPTAGAIAAAEKGFAALGAATALERRFATMADVGDRIWAPRALQRPAPTEGIFANVKPKGESLRAASMRVPATTMTWDKFQRTVLPTADKVEMHLEAVHQSFVALTTAVHADARPILQWDSEERRNPVAWYLYNNGSAPSDFNVQAGAFTDVMAITPKPPQWYGGGFEHQGEGAIFLLQGAKDLHGSASAAIFPACLRSELKPYAAVIEAFSRNSRVQEPDGTPVAGLLFAKDGKSPARLRVTSGGTVTEYTLDRWD